MTDAFVLFCTVNGPILPVEVLTNQNAAPVVPTGPPDAGFMKLASAVHLNRTAEVERCIEVNCGVKLAVGQRGELGTLLISKVNPALLTTSINTTLLITVPQLLVTTNL